MINYVLLRPNPIEVAISDVERACHSGGLQKNFPSGQIQQGRAYINGTCILLRYCFEVMNGVDQLNAWEAFSA